MRKPCFVPLLLLLAACTSPEPVRLQVVNDSQEKAVAIVVRCDGATVLDTVVAKFRTGADRLIRHLPLQPGLHRIEAEARGQRTRLDTTITTVGTNVLGLTFRFDSLAARVQTTYYADGAEGEVTFPAFYVRRSFRLYQYQARDPQRL
ncbi:hypothetical protein [Hymenobacter metallicola]|uniref:Lipoprotein n=1 Tax=Hymenobacter metallicola TaxID=2563114 RepID=A0A4Z0PZX1_9BACT|nr:hypothetical protein [Hymenobacter metallicola]TGE23330.1 hypothetical protein E5K02_19235 [Hymenobacter metallicola]